MSTFRYLQFDSTPTGSIYLWACLDQLECRARNNMASVDQLPLVGILSWLSKRNWKSKWSTVLSTLVLTYSNRVILFLKPQPLPIAIMEPSSFSMMSLVEQSHSSRRVSQFINSQLPWFSKREGPVLLSSAWNLTVIAVWRKQRWKTASVGGSLEMGRLSVEPRATHVNTGPPLYVYSGKHRRLPVAQHV